MNACWQTPEQTVMQHGESVCEHLFDLIGHIRLGKPLCESHWRLPDWFGAYGPRLVSKLHPEDKLRLYTKYHDCGKPYCQIFNEETGRHHFPNHAEVSRHVWKCVGGDEVVGLLIGNDMVVHTATAEEIDQKLNGEWSCEDSVSLLLAAIAEIHSNSKLFGGVASVSFKMKQKTVDKRGKRMCKHLFGQT